MGGGSLLPHKLPVSLICHSVSNAKLNLKNPLAFIHFLFYSLTNTSLCVSLCGLFFVVHTAKSHKRIPVGLFCHDVVLLPTPHLTSQMPSFHCLLKFPAFCIFRAICDHPYLIFHCIRKRDCCYQWKNISFSLVLFPVHTAWYFQNSLPLVLYSVPIVLIPFFQMK